MFFVLGQWPVDCTVVANGMFYRSVDAGGKGTQGVDIERCGEILEEPR